jgi:dTDP-4-amino-4,6-dideoxygalactose transaminase
MPQSVHSVPFNRPFFTGKELNYITAAVEQGQISGGGAFTIRCHEFFKNRYGFERCLLTSSCTDALEMCALLLDIEPGDEVIMPAYTFVSTANAFVLRGAEIKFADSSLDSPNIDPEHVRRLISERTKAIVVVHYGGIACDMDRLCKIAQQRDVPIVEDAAHAIDSYHRGRPLGGIGALSTFSFHETKNVICGEGGLLVVNDPKYWKRAEIIWQKGTDRMAFARKEVQKYQWMDIGSSFLPSEIIAAFLLSQLEHLEEIQARRVALWRRYRDQLLDLESSGKFSLQSIPDYATVNGHLFPIVVHSLDERDQLLRHLDGLGVNALFHYLLLNESPYFSSRHEVKALPNGKRFANGLVRLPLFYTLTDDQADFVCDAVRSFFLK